MTTIFTADPGMAYLHSALFLLLGFVDWCWQLLIIVEGLWGLQFLLIYAFIQVYYMFSNEDSFFWTEEFKYRHRSANGPQLQNTSCVNTSISKKTIVWKSSSTLWKVLYFVYIYLNCILFLKDTLIILNVLQKWTNNTSPNSVTLNSRFIFEIVVFEFYQ